MKDKVTPICITIIISIFIISVFSTICFNINKLHETKQIAIKQGLSQEVIQNRIVWINKR